MEPKVLGRPGFAIVTDIERPDPSLIEKLKEFPAAIVGDGLGRRGVMDAGIKPLNPNMRLVGPAITVEVAPGDNLMIHAAMKIARAGDVLVVYAHGDTSAGIWGNILASVAVKKGLAGVVIDGAVRDSQELVARNFPVFSRAVNPRGGTKDGPGQVNFPIACGGVAVRPGDVVVGDGDGVVVVPREHVGAAVEEARKRVEAEEKRLQAIEQGDLYPAWLIPQLRERGVLKEDDVL